MDFVIVGAQKAMTTFYQKCLSEHPSIYIPAGEVPIFEDKGLDQVKKYDINLVNKYPNKIIGIKRPDYLPSSYCAAKIQEYNPNMKIIIILRNPVKRAVSAYYHYIKMGMYPNIDINKSFDSIIGNTTDIISKKIIEYGYYGEQVENYKKLFKKNNIYIVVQENEVSDLRKSIQNMFRFLEVDSSYIPASLDKKIYGGIYSRVRLSFLNIFNKFYFKYNGNCTRMEIRNNLLSKLVRAIVTIIDRYILSIIFKDKQQLSNTMTEKLYGIYKSDIDKLASDNNLDLHSWLIHRSKS